MANKKTPVSPSLASVRKGKHGELHNWLHAHRRSILRVVAAEGQVLTWEPFIKLMTAAGITLADGSPLTTARVRRSWFDVAARIEKEAEARALGPPRRPRCYKKNVEPPSRPPPPDTGIRFPSWMTEEPPGFREQYPESYLPVAPPTPPAPPVHSSSPIPAQPHNAASSSLERAIQTLRDMNETVPPPIVRGKIV